MNLAPGVSFDEAKHEYWYKGKQLSGITGLVAKKLGLKYSNTFVGEHAEEGIHIHKAIQKWIETGKVESVHPGVAWIIGQLERSKEITSLLSEVLISDFKQYASAVDVVEMNGDGSVCIYDIKKGKFNREYVTWQLSIYKYLIEKTTKFKVSSCMCIAVKDKDVYKIFPKKPEEVHGVLYGM